MTSEWHERVRELAADHHSPSSALATRSAELLAEVAENDPELLAEVARGIVLAQPAMAALANVANVALRAVQALGLASVPKALQALQRGIDQDRRDAALALSEAIDGPVQVVTTSASAAVIEALQVLRSKDLLLGVTCGESRPLLEGTALARWLVDQAYDVTVTSDAGLCEHLLPGAIYVSGTDAILPRHIVNKLGTRVYATWARLNRIPAYVLASRDKLYPVELIARFCNPDRPRTELVQNPPEALHIDNRAFDLTAREVWTRIFVGRNSLEVAESHGDHALAEGLRSLCRSD